MQPIDVGILVGFVAVCAAIVLLVLAVPKPKGQYHAHPEQLTEEKQATTRDRLRVIARERSADVQSISNRRRR